jgi:hypothetical protein
VQSSRSSAGARVPLRAGVNLVALFPVYQPELRSLRAVDQAVPVALSELLQCRAHSAGNVPSPQPTTVMLTRHHIITIWQATSYLPAIA